MLRLHDSTGFQAERLVVRDDYKTLEHAMHISYNLAGEKGVVITGQPGIGTLCVVGNINISRCHALK